MGKKEARKKEVINMENSILNEQVVYEEKGQMAGAVGAVVTLITGVGVAVLVLIFVGSLGGQTYQLVEDDLTAITNATVEQSVKNSIISGFEALEQTGSYLPIIVLAFIIALVLALVLGMTGGFGRTGNSGGTAL